jgi:hypothetical protein
MRLLAALYAVGVVFLVHAVLSPTAHLDDFEMLMIIGTVVWFVWTTVTEPRT